MRTRTLVLAVCAAMLALATACGRATTAQADGAALARARCGTCHGLERLKGVPDDREAWASVVERMVDRGASLTDEEADVLVDFLAAGGAREL